MVGGAGDDYIDGGAEGAGHDDTLEGGLGNDTLIDSGLSSRDWVSYGNASGSVTVDLQTGAASGADGDDSLANIEAVQGSDYNDSLVSSTAGDSLAGGAGDDTLVSGNTTTTADYLYGGDGDDSLVASTGRNVIEGGAGTDWLDLTAADAGVDLDMGYTGAQNTGGAGDIDLQRDIEVIIGSDYGDTLEGYSGNAETLLGGAGDDSLVSEGAGDWLDGGGRRRYSLR